MKRVEKVGIIQSSSYLGEAIDLIDDVDLFVFYDDASIQKETGGIGIFQIGEWPIGFTVPVQASARSAKIQDVLVDYEQPWYKGLKHSSLTTTVKAHMDCSTSRDAHDHRQKSPKSSLTSI